MVHDSVWELGGLGKHEGKLCIGCLEQRLGRKLCPEDFTDALVNTRGPRSQRHLDRMGIVA